MINGKQKITNLIRIVPIMGVIIVAITLILISIFGINKHFSNHLAKTSIKVKEDAIKVAKKDILSVINVAENTRQIMQKSINTDLVLFVDFGYKFMNFAKSKNKNVPREKLLQKIIEFLQTLYFKHQNSYFIYDFNGKPILATPNTKYTLDQQNLKSGDIVKNEFIDELKDFPSGVFNEWYIYNKEHTKILNQIGYAKYNPVLKVFIGSYFDENQIKKYMYNRIMLFLTKSKLRDIAMTTMDKKILFTSMKGTEFKGLIDFDEAIRNPLKIITYKKDDEIYVYAYDKLLNLFFVREVRLDKIATIIQEVKKNVDKLVNRVISQFLTTAIIFIIIILIIMVKITKLIEKMFEEYEHELQVEKEKAQQAAKVKSEFLANMSHEIRTPLNAMFGFIKILQEKQLDDESKNYLNIIEKSGNNLLTIINDILDFSKIEAGKFAIEYIEFNPKEEIEVLHQLFANKASEKNITLEINENLEYNISSDPTRLKQVIANLLSNAIKFTPKDKKIILNVKYNKKTEELYVEVIDEGIGIPKEKVATIFEAFSQADNSTTRKYGGTGLGLTISYKLIKLLGGKLKVESEENKGSKFYFTIPAKKVGKSKYVKKETSIKPSTFNYHILVVEDNFANQMFMKVILKKMGITFDIANNGEEAIEKFKQNKYDFILMDENMPKMNGIEATKHIRNIEKENNLYHTIIIALTANALEGDKERFILAGMDYYLSKPLDVEKLQKILQQALKGK